MYICVCIKHLLTCEGSTDISLSPRENCKYCMKCNYVVYTHVDIIQQHNMLSNI